MNHKEMEYNVSFVYILFFFVHILSSQTLDLWREYI